MTQHPYVGLAGTIDDRHRQSHGQRGVVELCDGHGAMLLLNSGRHEWVGLPCFVPDDPAEARRRLTGATVDRWEAWCGDVGSHPDGADCDVAPAGWEWVGPWEPCGLDGSVRDWKRALRRVSRG